MVLMVASFFISNVSVLFISNAFSRGFLFSDKLFQISNNKVDFLILTAYLFANL